MFYKFPMHAHLEYKKLMHGMRSLCVITDINIQWLDAYQNVGQPYINIIKVFNPGAHIFC